MFTLTFAALCVCVCGGVVVGSGVVGGGEQKLIMLVQKMYILRVRWHSQQCLAKGNFTSKSRR